MIQFIKIWAFGDFIFVIQAKIAGKQEHLALRKLASRYRVERTFHSRPFSFQNLFLLSLLSQI